MFLFDEMLSRPALRARKVTLPLGQWVRVARERRRLGALDERMLRDIGVDAASASEESARPFWDLPKRH